MMRSRAVLISVIAHLVAFALAGGIYWRHREREQALLNTPIGDVFVQEGSLGGKRPRPEAGPRPQEPAEAAPGAEEGEAPEGAGAEGGTDAGLPDGEAFPLGTIAPEYPPLSRELGEEGSATFLLGIAENGTVTSAVLEQGSGHGRLDQAARKALLAARFQPGVLEGVPTPSMKRYTVEFRLEKNRKSAAH